MQQSLKCIHAISIGELIFLGELLSPTCSKCDHTNDESSDKKYGKCLTHFIGIMIYDVDEFMDTKDC